MTGGHAKIEAYGWGYLIWLQSIALLLLARGLAAHYRMVACNDRRAAASDGHSVRESILCRIRKR